MTSALAAAVRELDRSRDRLEQELSQNPDYAALRSLERSSVAESPEVLQRKQFLMARLEAMPLYQVLQAIVAARSHVIEGDAIDAGTGQSRTVAITTSASSSIDAQVEPAKLPPSFTPPDGPAQPLTAIRGITLALAKQLQSLGIQRYEQIADWRAEDVRDVTTELGLGRSISQRNWIEQAAVLAMRAPDGWRPAARLPKESAAPEAPAEVATPASQPVMPTPHDDVSAPATTAATTAPALGDMLRVVAAGARAAVAGAAAVARTKVQSTPIRESEPADAPRSSPAASPLVLPDTLEGAPPSLPALQPVKEVAELPVRAPLPADPPADLLHHIQGIDAAIARKLAGAGVCRFSVIAAWQPGDLATIAEHLGLPARRISREGWIEQAAVLATGRETKFSRRVAGGDGDAPLPSFPPRSPTPPPAAPAPARAFTPAALLAGVADAPAPRFDAMPVAVPAAPMLETAVPLSPQLPSSPAPAPTMSIRIGERPMLDHGGALVAGLSADPRQAPSDDADSADTDRDSPMARVSRLDRSLARLIEDNAAPSVLEEATVTFVTHAALPSANAAAAAESVAAVPQKAPLPIFRPPPRPARPPNAAPYTHRSEGMPAASSGVGQPEPPRSQPAGASRAVGAGAAAESVTEEAMVEIIRRDDPLAPLGGGGVGTAAFNRGPPLTAGPRRGASAQYDQQPAWIAEKNEQAGGVVRRFLKALKRDA